MAGRRSRRWSKINALRFFVVFSGYSSSCPTSPPPWSPALLQVSLSHNPDQTDSRRRCPCAACPDKSYPGRHSGEKLRAGIRLSGRESVSSSYPLPFQRLFHLAKESPNANLVTLLISAISICLLFCGKQFLTPFLTKKYNLRLPIPYEVLLVGTASALSYYFNWNGRFHVQIVGNIPAGWVEILWKGTSELQCPNPRAASCPVSGRRPAAVLVHRRGHHRRPRFHGQDVRPPV